MLISDCIKVMRMEETQTKEQIYSETIHITKDECLRIKGANISQPVFGSFNTSVCLFTQLMIISDAIPVWFIRRNVLK